ncbi:unnamed protein product [Sphagnum tenellum]
MELLLLQAHKSMAATTSVAPSSLFRSVTIRNCSITRNQKQQQKLRPCSVARSISSQSRLQAVAKAKEAAESGALTLFDKIVSRQIPSTVVYEDDKVLAFRDISPQAPVHIIIIPKDRDGLTQLSKAEERHTEILGHLMVTAAVVAKQEGLVDGFRVVVNDGVQGCQSVYHLHLHLLGGRQMNWPPG